MGSVCFLFMESTAIHLFCQLIYCIFSYIHDHILTTNLKNFQDHLTIISLHFLKIFCFVLNSVILDSFCYFLHIFYQKVSPIFTTRESFFSCKINRIAFKTHLLILLFHLRFRKVISFG